MTLRDHFLRSFSFLLIASAGVSQAQDFDLYVQGQVLDAATGEPISFAQLTVTDQLDTTFHAPVWATANGEYTRDLYTSAVWEGGRYTLQYTAEGYAPRTATIDASNVEEGQDMTIAWRITMDVELEREGSAVALPADIGTCLYDPRRSTFRWEEKEARKAYPIRRYKDDRIVAHASIVDSVNALEGVTLQGRVLSHWNEAALQNVTVRIEAQEDDTSYELTTDRYGFYIYSLPYDKVYHVTYSGDELVNKTMVIDLTGVPQEVREDGMATILDVRLFQPLPEEDLTFLQEPIARMEYSPEAQNLEWDMQEAKPILQRLDTILSRYAATSYRGN